MSSPRSTPTSSPHVLTYRSCQSILCVADGSRRFNRSEFVKSAWSEKYRAAASFSFSAAPASKLCNLGVIPPRGQSLHPDHSLAAVFSRQQPDQRLRRVLQAVDDVLLNLQFAAGDPALQVGQRFLALRHEIHHDE